MYMNPPATMETLKFFPLRDMSGSKATNSMITVMGAKQKINNVAIVATILDTFRFRMETLSTCASLVVLFLQLVLLRSWTDRITVLIATITNAHRGIKKLLIAKVNISTCSLSSVKTIPTKVLFFKKENLLPNLLTTYTGAALNVKMMKIHAVVTPALPGVIRFFTCVNMI